MASVGRNRHSPGTPDISAKTAMEQQVKFFMRQYVDEFPRK